MNGPVEPFKIKMVEHVKIPPEKRTLRKPKRSSEGPIVRL